ncbi:MAG TPA: hypothetical protein VFH78_04140 [Candidatus Thermoplasmatota archaeon]|nr:hypothetical protein [Candidatus Thermoplasmatota archaeon]
MNGVGELFGRSVDAVLRRPRTALVPLMVDVVWLLVGTALFLTLASVTILFPQGYRLPTFPVAVPHALPTVGDVMGPTPSSEIHLFGSGAIAAATLLILVGIPLLAYAEAGFLGVLRAVYLARHDPLEEGRHVDAWSRIREAFASSGRRHFRTFVVLRVIQAGLALVALALPVAFPRVPNTGLAILAVDVLLLYAPYAAVETKRGSIAAMRESVQLVSDHLATTLVALLFGFLLTGGIGYVAEQAVRWLGVYTPFVAAVVYAPVGTLLALFLYRVYLSFYPQDILPGSVPAPHVAPA